MKDTCVRKINEGKLSCRRKGREFISTRRFSRFSPGNKVVEYRYMVRIYLCAPPPPLLLLLLLCEMARVLISHRTSFFSYFLTWDPKSPVTRNLDLETKTSDHGIRTLAKKIGREFLLSYRDSESPMNAGKLQKRRSPSSRRSLEINFHRERKLNVPLKIVFESLISKLLRRQFAFFLNSLLAPWIWIFVSKVKEVTRYFCQHDNIIHVSFMNLWSQNLSCLRLAVAIFPLFLDPTLPRAFIQTYTYFSFFFVYSPFQEECLNQGLTSLYSQQMLVEINSLSY